MRYAWLLVVLALLPQDKIALKWKLAKGQELRYELQQKFIVESDAFNWDQASTMTYQQVVKDVDAKGEATCDMTYEVVRFKLSGFADTEYDSSKDKQPPDDPVGGAVAQLVGKTFTMKLSPSGRITSVSGFDKIADKMTEDLGEGTEMAQGLIKQIWNDESQRAMLQQAFVQLPAEPVAPGETWKSDFPFDLGMMGKFTFNLTGTLKSASGDDAKIAQDIKVTASEGSGSMLELSDGKGKNEAVFQLGKGLLGESTMDAELKMKMGDGEFPVKLTAKLKLLGDKSVEKKK